MPAAQKISIELASTMPLSKREASTVFKALPLLHIAILLILSLLIVSILWFIPKTPEITSRPFIIPEERLGKSIVVTVRAGDNFSLVAKRAELSSSEIFQIIESGPDAKRLLDLRPEQKIIFHFNKLDEFTSLIYRPNITETLTVIKEDETYQANIEVKELEKQIHFASGLVQDSLFLAANKAGLDDNITMELVNILGWDIDFSLDIRSGDQFALIYEENYLDGQKVSNGNILLAQFINQGREVIAVRYEDSNGRADYFTPEGLSMRKAFRRNPLDVVRITSHFNLKRKHPVLHKIRAHKGVDYAASTGTPVRAAGDGKVIKASRYGGYGNVVILQHGQRYSTLYAHLSKYGRGVREGRYVKQGQIIGYVGSTGLATGPHLHYEFRVNGVHRNPLTISLPSAKPIDKAEKENYLQHAQAEIARLRAYEEKQLEN